MMPCFTSMVWIRPLWVLVLWTPVAATQSGLEAGPTKPPSERDLVRAFEQAFASLHEQERLAAVHCLDNESRAIEGLRGSGDIATALARGLGDPSSLVVDATIEALRDGRHPARAVRALADFVTARCHQVRDVAMLPTDPGSADTLRAIQSPLPAAMDAIAGYRSADGLQVLCDELRRFGYEAIFTWVKLKDLQLHLIDAILSHRCAPAFDAVIEHMATCPSTEGLRPRLFEVSQKLRALSFELGLEPVGFPENIASAWRDWFRKNEGKIPRRP